MVLLPLITIRILWTNLNNLFFKWQNLSISNVISEDFTLSHTCHHNQVKLVRQLVVISYFHPNTGNLSQYVELLLQTTFDGRPTLSSKVFPVKKSTRQNRWKPSIDIVLWTQKKAEDRRTDRQTDRQWFAHRRYANYFIVIKLTFF